MSRSNLICNIILLLSEGAIYFEDFSDELKGTVGVFIDK